MPFVSKASKRGYGLTSPGPAATLAICDTCPLPCMCPAQRILSTLSCFSRAPLFVTPMDCSPPGSSVHGDSPGKNTRVACHLLLQGIFLTQGLNLHLLCLLHQQVGSLPLPPPVKPARRVAQCNQNSKPLLTALASVSPPIQWGGGINLLWLIELWLKGTFNGYEGAFHPNGSERNSTDDCLESGC